ncbi:MAG: hypothetical protein KI793_28870 [Rivularia sp. (in: Bacteria)]|nr:hypothetical protein [Rivularia sp. MS3]
MPNQESAFLEHLLRKRLDRVPPEIIRSFLEKQSVNVDLIKTKKGLLDKLLGHQSIMKKNETFNQDFDIFIRDYVLSAGVSEYILQVQNTNLVFQWIKKWKNNTFFGQKHKFQIHTSRKLGEGFIKFDKDEEGNISSSLIDEIIPNKNSDNEDTIISLPNSVIFLVASTLDTVYALDGLRQVEYHRTSEFEIVFRKNLSLIEIRGDYKVIKDFVTTAILDNDNPLSMAASIFIGEEEDLQNSLIRISRRRIGIDALRQTLNGSFLNISSIVDGSKTNKIKIYLDELQNWDEETEPLLRELIKKVQPTLDKGRIAFKYKNKKYSFMITKTGGLRFYEYVSEEVVTYLLYFINRIA